MDKDEIRKKINNLDGNLNKINNNNSSNPVPKKTFRAFDKACEKGDVEEPELSKEKVLDLTDIMNSFNFELNEVEEIRRIGKEIAHRMRTIQWLTWTLFPFEFENCHTDAELRQAIDNLNAWMKDVGLIK